MSIIAFFSAKAPMRMSSVIKGMSRGPRLKVILLIWFRKKQADTQLL